jgi:hypothetical protein
MDANIDSKTLRKNARAALRAAKKEQARVLAACDDNEPIAGMGHGETFLIALGMGVDKAERELEEVEAIIAARGKASRRAYAAWAYPNGYARNF